MNKPQPNSPAGQALRRLKMELSRVYEGQRKQMGITCRICGWHLSTGHPLCTDLEVLGDFNKWFAEEPMAQVIAEEADDS